VNVILSAGFDPLNVSKHNKPEKNLLIDQKMSQSIYNIK